MKKSTISILILTQLAFLHAQSPFQSDLPYYAYRYSSIKVDSMVYFVGGSGQGPKIDSVYSYNLNSNQWNNLPNMEQSRSNMGLLYLNQKMYALKGRDGGNWMEYFDLTSNTWYTLSDDSGDLIGNGNTTYNNFYTVCNGKMYATNYWFTNLWSSLNGLIWTAHNANLSFGEPTLVSSDSKVYIISGDGSNGAFYEYDPVTNTFNQLSSFSIIERGYQNNAIYKDGKIYKFNNMNYDQQIEKYDITTDTWTIYDFPYSFNQELEYIEVDPNQSKFYLFGSRSELAQPGDGNNRNGFYFFADDDPHITIMSDMEMYEDDTLEIFLSAFSLGSESYYFNATSDTADVQITLNTDTLLVIPSPNWTGTCQITASLYTNNNYSDTTIFTVSVLQTDPIILSILDVPNDQGGRVYIDFQKSYLDMGGYLDWLAGYQVERMDTDGWVGVGTYNAYGAETYTIEVNTLSDSTNESNGMSVFRVIANMNEGNFFSDPDSGYSIDNIAPAVPTGLMATAISDSINLDWDMSLENDFHYYVLEKSTEQEFSNYETIHTIENAYNDTECELNLTYYYRLSVADYSGNISEYSETVEATVLSIDGDLIPVEFALRQNYPNPFNPITTLRYDIPENGLVNIIIYDMLGKQVKTLMDQTQDAGYRSVIWDATNDYGKPVSAGIYLYQIQAGEYMQTKKMVLLK